MKKIAIILLLFLAITRADLYKKFGPLELEAIVLIIKDEINILRQIAELQPRTNQQILDAIGNKLETLEEYDWMKEKP